MNHPLRVIVFIAIASATIQVRAADHDPAGLMLFEKRIRPLLVEHCFECHSAGKKVKGGLRLDSREGLEKGGDSGASVVPGKPDESLLIEALRHEGAVKMPPKGKLPDSALRDFERWIQLGAPDPRRADDAKAGLLTPVDIETGRRLWSYRPIIKTPAPAVRDPDWPHSAIDRFILSRLEAGGLKPAPQAAPETLVRRVYFDLVGLPPTPEQIDAFLADATPDAWERLVDRLLASPQFGERWGRHWLDVVRFGESLTLRGFILKEAWRYRDYVIESFDQDLPFDQFLREQIAGDLLPVTTVPHATRGAEALKQRQRQLVATTMLMLGNHNLEEQDKPQLEMDLIDEQLDVIGRGFLAQTITCARCHDHKFDPIPTRDYYALAGILKNARTLDHENISKWVEVPLPLEPDQEAFFQQRDKDLAAAEAVLAASRSALKKAAESHSAIPPTIVAAKDLPGIVVDDSAATRVGVWEHSTSVRSYVGDGYLHDGDGGKGEKTLTFDPDLPETGIYEVRLAYTPADNRSPKVPVTVFSADGEKTIEVNERETPPIEGQFVSLGQYRFERGGQSFVIVSNAGTLGHVVADAMQFIPAAGLATPANSTGKKVSEKELPESDEIKMLREEVKQREASLKQLKASGPKRPMVISVAEKAKPENLFIHVRGIVHNRGAVAPRGFLQVATLPNSPAIPEESGGRRELADWIASSENPLTARVIVNRVWHWLFGAGLVRTADNFGTTGEAPSHPELLDSLAAKFIDDGWSIKRLVRTIVLSRTYRLATAESVECRTIDPENRLLSHANRRRLDAECLRDAMLLAGQTLEWERGGPSYPSDLAADYGFRDFPPRRSVYLPVFRNALPEMFEMFDFADPSLVTGRRTTSTVAPQALFLLNHPFVLEQSDIVARRVLAENCADDAARLLRAYRLVLGRPPARDERDAASRYLGSADSSDAGSRPRMWSQLVQALFATHQFRYVD